MTRNSFIWSLVFVCCLMVLGAGCSSLDLKKSPVAWPAKTAEYESPERLIGVWTDTVYQHPGKAPTRGFGGRIYFYNAQGKVIPVDGELVVYAYDESSPDVARDKPTRKYAFTAEQLTRYYSESDLGASYNIWIPWDHVGNEEKQISLFPVFVNTEGRMVRGNFANNRLPGRRVQTEEERRGFYVAPHKAQHAVPAPAGQAVQQVQFQAPVAGDVANGSSKGSGMKTTTIRIPRSLAERMSAVTPSIQQVQQRAQPVRVSSTMPRPPAAAPAATSTPPAAPNMLTPDQVQTLMLPNSNSAATPATDASHPYPTNGTGVENPPLGQQGFIGVDPQNSVSATSRAWARQHEQSARFELPKFRVPAKPGVQRHLGRVASRPTP